MTTEETAGMTRYVTGQTVIDLIGEAYRVLADHDVPDGKTADPAVHEHLGYMDDDWCKMAQRVIRGYAEHNRRPVRWPWTSPEFDRFPWLTDAAEPPTGPLALSAVAVDEAEEALASVGVPLHATCSYSSKVDADGSRSEPRWVCTMGCPGPEAAIADCCDLHGPACEPPSELCCANCTEAAHPDHAPGVSCVLKPDPHLHLETREPQGTGVWTHRVKLTDRQAILGFPKFATIGIGFAVEDDGWDLPYTVDAERIYEHIACNKGDDLISRQDCIEAIRLIQAAIIRERAQADSPPA